MLLWIAIAVLTAGVLWALARPLRAAGPTPKDGEGEIEVYRHQLKELETDRQRGLLEAGEAQAARVEISRRLLAEAARGANAAPSAGTARAAATVRWLLHGVVAGVPALALCLYAVFGAWWLEGKPHAAHTSVPPAQASVAELLARVEARLRERPDDGQGWDVIAPVYLKIGRYAEAAQAYGRAMRLLGENARRLAGFAEAAVLASNGIVTEEARRAYEALAKLDPDRPEPRFWLALAKEQDGRLDAAAADYGALLAAAPADAPWRRVVEQRLATITARLGTAAPQAGRGPRPEDAAAAQELPAEERTRMIEAMVEGLAERLKSNGNDLEGWRRLLRSYTVLGQRAKAAEALARARTALAGDSAALADLEQFAKTLGLGS